VIRTSEFEDHLYYQSGSGLYLPEHLRPQKRPLAMDFFSGAGGMSLGLIEGGFDVIAALEMDMTAIHTYLLNLGAYPVQMIYIEPEDRKRAERYFEKSLNKIRAENGIIKEAFQSGSNRHNVTRSDFEGVRYMFIGDIRKITGSQILDVIGLKRGELDLIAGGPPCQGFSTSGKQDVMDPRNSLVFEFAKIIVEVQPKTMVMENVPGILDMVTPEGLPVVDAFCKILEDGEYGSYDALKRSLLSSAGCGAALKKSHGTRKGLKDQKHSDEETSVCAFQQTELFA